MKKSTINDFHEKKKYIYISFTRWYFARMEKCEKSVKGKNREWKEREKSKRKRKGKRVEK